MFFPGVNFGKPAGASPAAAAAKEPNVTIVAIDDILSHPPRDSKGVKMLGNIALIAGARMYQFYMTPSKFKATFDPEGDEDAVTYKQKVEAELPGDGLSLNEFIYAWTGINVQVIFGSCSDDFQKVYGTKCAPLQLKATSQDDNEARKKMVTFEQFAKSKFLPGHYTGSLVLSAPSQAAGTQFALLNLYPQVQLPSLAVTSAIEFTQVVMDHGAIATLIGGGGIAPATLEQGPSAAAELNDSNVEVILVAGTTWTGLRDAVIHLQVFNAGDITYLIELSRG